MVKSCETKAVLVIEDEADIRNFAARVLEMEGYHVLQAGDGEEGMRLAREAQIGLVLLDLRLPKHSGWEVLMLLKSEPELSVIPVIVFTASAAVADHERAMQMAAADYLIKPMSAASLKEAVACILRQER